MVNYKLVLEDKRARIDGNYPIVIRITFNRNNTSYRTGVKVSKEFWDDRTQRITKEHPNHQQLNASVATYYLKVQKAVHKLIDDNTFNFETLKESLTVSPNTQRVQVNFYDFSQKLITEMIQVKRTGNAIVYKTAVNKLISFAGTKKIKFKDINYAFLESFRHQMILDGARVNTVGNYFRSIRAIYNKAIKAKVIDRGSYPFSEISIKQERTAKRAIGIDDIKNLLKLQLKPNSAAWHARNYFILSFCLIGISFTDLIYLKQQNLIKGRVEYKRRKTHKRYSISLTPYAKELFGNYGQTSNGYILPLLPKNIMEDSLEAKKAITQAIKTTNKYLKRLGKEIGLDTALTTYVARHTWATTAKRIGYSNELIAEAMGHEYGNKITNIYLDSFDQTVIDELNEKVISQLFEKIK